MSNEIQIQEDEIDLLDIVGVLIRHKKQIIFTTITALVFILGFSVLSLKLPPEISFLPNKYKPVSTVKINNVDSGGISSLMGGSSIGALGNLIGLDSGSNSNAALAVKLAKSRTVLDQLATEFNLLQIYQNNKHFDEKFPVTSLRKIISRNITVEEDEDTATLTFAYEDIDRNLATRIVNRLVGILEESFTEIDLTSNTNQKKLLEEKLQEADVKMKQLQDEIISFQEQNDVLDATTMAAEMTTRVMQLKTQITMAEAEMETMRERLPPQDPTLRIKNLEVEGLKDVLFALETGMGSSGLPALNTMPALVLTYEAKKRLLSTQASIYGALLQQYELTKLQDKGTGPTFQVIEKAEIPEMKSSPSRGKLSIIVTMVAFIFSVFGAFIKEFWDNLKNDPRRMAKLKGTDK